MVQRKTVFGSSFSCRHDAFSFSGHLPNAAGQRERFVLYFEGPNDLAWSIVQALSRSTVARVIDHLFWEEEVDAWRIGVGDLIRESKHWRRPRIDIISYD